jgi:hypothetical protein
MKITDFLSDVGRPVAYFPKLRHITGSVNATLFLCQLIYWEGKQASKTGWIYKTHSEMEEETGLSRREQETARRKLKDLGLIEERLAGVPQRLHYRLNKKKINDAWDTFVQSENKQPLKTTISQDEECMHETNKQNIQSEESMHKNAHSNATNKDIQMRQIRTSNTKTTTEITRETTIDDSLRSSLTVEKKVKEKDLVPTKLESKALVKDSKYSKNETKDISLDSVVQLASQKSIERRNAKSKVPRKAPQNANTIVAYFGEKFKETLGGIAPLELGKDRKLMKQMIEHYGYDTVKVYIDWMFRNWAQFRRDCKLNGVPTIGMLYGFRSYLQEQNMYVDEINTEEGDSVWGV